MIILSSPSGAGKTTLVKLISKNKSLIVSVSHTTRKPRPNEINGVDYYFVNKSTFEDLINKNEFLEYANVFNNFYGTSKKKITQKLDEGKNILFDIDWQGAEQIKLRNLKYKIISIFILPPSKDVLRKRLSNRDMKDKLIVEERMKQFDKDILHWKNYDFVVINDDLNKCYKEISDVIDNSMLLKKKILYNKKFIAEHVKKLTS